MIITNTNDKEMDLKTDFCEEILNDREIPTNSGLRGVKTGRNVMNDEVISDLSVLKIPAQTAWVLEVK
jgi:hypothetical protein